MFKSPFSFEGRIRRSEYAFTLLVYLFFHLNMIVFIEYLEWTIILVSIPFIWMLFAQGAKRCHDLGNSGWWQIIPLYLLVMIFGDGRKGVNDYGNDPRGHQITSRI
jgi:uncharacterized membrane protein YhaH (DUF805 family)